MYFQNILFFYLHSRTFFSPLVLERGWGRERERKREREKYWCGRETPIGCLLQCSLTGEQICNLPGYVPQPGMEPMTFPSTEQQTLQPTESHWPGLRKYCLNVYTTFHRLDIQSFEFIGFESWNVIYSIYSSLLCVCVMEICSNQSKILQKL